MAILVFTENWEGKFKKLSYELASYAARIAEMMNLPAMALTIGNPDPDELEKLGHYGLKKILVAHGKNLGTLDNQVYASIIGDIALQVSASVLILSNNGTGKALAPRLAVRLKAGLASGVNGLPISTEPFVLRKRAYSGNAFAHVAIHTPVKILTLSQNSFELIDKQSKAEIETFQVTPDSNLMKTKVTDVQKQTGKLLLTDAEIVVSGGRGMKSPDNWGPLIELADLLGAALACSRPVSDEGWRSHEEHTGQTGKVIAPNLYFAVGISGATQHLAGVSSSKYIVAVNTDKDAPVFEAAQYGIVGDALKVLPKLVEAVREMKSK
ncbi:MAG: electron transfer flavoprotein subunit alpha/FixB family protein [Bacteroidetes bacterium]|nr:electron transfer flavoprotein subunit alpha/FixB family protein [Bacteroidota bacterium]